MTSSERVGAYLKSEFHVVRKASDEQSSESARRVLLYWYDTWPDMGVPSDVDGVTSMLKSIRLEHDGASSKPWVVHCSAGIGRTGTFIAIDMGLRRLLESGSVEVSDLITTMRRERGGMVQTFVQADFVHRALTELADELDRQPRGNSE